MTNRNAPPLNCAVSVIIPMYNAEKFVRQCLISVLASKFTDYEVLVIDDCSTDNSVDEVKKVLPHFDGRLKLLSTEKNSGGASVPRNVGINHAVGKYLTFVDSDDMLVPTALGEFFKLAEKFQADVIHTEKFLYFREEAEDKSFKLDFTTENLIEEPQLESAELGERIRRYITGEFFWSTWGKFYRRELLIKNKILFQHMQLSEDMIFCFKCLCLARNYLRVPNVTNIYRLREGSMSHKNLNPSEGIKRWLSVVTSGTSNLDKFMGEQSFFQQNPEAQRAVEKFFLGTHFKMINLFPSMPAHKIQEIFFDALQSPELDEHGKSIVAAYLYAEYIINFKR